MEMKKNPKLDYRRTSGMFFNLGLVVSLLLAITAFEWKFPLNGEQIVLNGHSEFEEPELVLATIHTTPPPPKVVPVNVVEVPDDAKIELPEIEFVLDPDQSGNIPPVVFSIPEPKDEPTEEPINIAEVMPEFDGGLAAFYKFVSNKLKYPAQARKLGIEGKVFVNFVVDKDGSLSQVAIARGIGAGCDEEVLRILAMSPKWKPGRQGGRPVKVRMMMPIHFRLD